MSTSSGQSFRWGGGGGGSVLGNGFPSFQFDADDVLSGKVKVFAKSPSGRVQPMNVLDADGQFNANFTPDEVGTCLQFRRLRSVQDGWDPAKFRLSFYIHDPACPVTVLISIVSGLCQDRGSCCQEL